ncbi:MAG: sulfotransferase domain-containing protein [Nodosilinea sp.]
MFKRFVSSLLNPSQKTVAKSLLMYRQEKSTDLESGAPDRDFQLDYKLPRKILIGTHHKAGTVWLISVFKSICNYYALKFYTDHQGVAPPAEFDIFLQQHSKFDFDVLPASFRGVHIIRDPRDIIISACFYHQRSTEEWLHKPQKKWQGCSYQQKLNSYDSPDEKIIFEMENSSRRNIEKILSWNYQNPGFYEVKYEDLIQDTDLILFHNVFSFLGFSGSEIPKLLMFAYDNSLFSGKVASDHVRSGTTKQWRKHFKPIHRERFLELFGDGLVRLGYEEDDDWL